MRRPFKKDMTISKRLGYDSFDLQIDHVPKDVQVSFRSMPDSIATLNLIGTNTASVVKFLDMAGIELYKLFILFFMRSLMRPSIRVLFIYHYLKFGHSKLHYLNVSLNSDLPYLNQELLMR